jgi:hypothetical protein
MSSTVNWAKFSARIIDFLYEGDGEDDLVDIKRHFDDRWGRSSSIVVLTSPVDKLSPLWSLMRAGFRLN